MRSTSKFAILPLFAAAAVAGCAPDNVVPVLARDTPAFSVIPGGCAHPAVTTGILPPINADNTSSYQLGRTLPVKIRFTDCVTGEAVNTLTPVISLVLVGDGGGPVNEVESSSAADDGNTMRSAGDGQYIFNLSTKRSQFNAGQDLTPGVYQLTISSPASFADVVVQFTIRP